MVVFPSEESQAATHRGPSSLLAVPTGLCAGSQAVPGAGHTRNGKPGRESEGQMPGREVLTRREEETSELSSCGYQSKDKGLSPLTSSPPFSVLSHATNTPKVA